MTNEHDNSMLTAYAMGELSGPDAAAVEARLAADPAARAELDEIRQVADLLTAELQSEPAPPLAVSQREAIEGAAPLAASQRLRWPLIAGLAAAAAAIIAIGIFAFGPANDGPKTPLADKPDPINGGGDTPDPMGSQPPETRPAPIPGDRVALKISLPDPMFKGTPKPIKGEPNMGPIRKGKRPPFLAPKGTVNLAAGKPVKSSDPEPIIGELKYATDGEKAGGDGYFVELAPGKQWITIDLGQQSTIYAITLWHYHQQGRAYRDVVVEVAKDEDFIESTTVFNNDHDNSSGQGKGKDKVYVEDYQGKLIDCKGVQGRHIRLWSKENTTDESNHYIEVEVYGKPVATKSN